MGWYGLSWRGMGDSWWRFIIPSFRDPIRNAISSDSFFKMKSLDSLRKAVATSKVRSCSFFCVACLSNSRIDFVLFLTGVVKVEVVSLPACCWWISWVVWNNVTVESSSSSEVVFSSSCSLSSVAGPDNASTIGTLWCSSSSVSVELASSYCSPSRYGKLESSSSSYSSLSS